MKKENQKVLVYRDEKRIKEKRKRIEAALPLFQKMIDEAEKVNLEITKDNFVYAESFPEKFYKDFLAGSNDKVKELVRKFRIKPTAAVDLIDLPYANDFIVAARGFRDYTQTNSVLEKFFTIVNRKAAINEVGLQEYIEKQSEYACTLQEKKVLNVYTKMINAVNDFNDFVCNECGRSGMELASDFHLFAERDFQGKDNTNKKFKVRLSKYKELAARFDTVEDLI